MKKKASEIREERTRECERKTAEKLIMQPDPETCGQACIAMITGKHIQVYNLSSPTKR